MKTLLVGIVLIGLLLVGCNEPSTADQLEEQLEIVLAGGDESFGHIEIVEYSDAAIIRGRISSLSLQITLLGMRDIDIPDTITDLEITHSRTGLTARKWYRQMCAMLICGPGAIDVVDVANCLSTIADLYGDIDKLR